MILWNSNPLDEVFPVREEIFWQHKNQQHVIRCQILSLSAVKWSFSSCDRRLWPMTYDLNLRTWPTQEVQRVSNIYIKGHLVRQLSSAQTARQLLGPRAACRWYLMRFAMCSTSKNFQRHANRNWLTWQSIKWMYSAGQCSRSTYALQRSLGNSVCSSFINGINSTWANRSLARVYHL